MRGIVLGGLVCWTHFACRRIRRDPRRYPFFAWVHGLLVLLSMLVQEGVLLFSGLLDWSNGLPLHLCSMMGLLTLPMLLARRRTLCSAALFLGMPGGVLALLFPAMLVTPWPTLTAAAFHTLHAGLVCAPWLPIARGWRPVPADALRAGLMLLTLGGLAMLLNPLTGGNYLFLARPVGGTPLALLAQWGIGPYRLLLAQLATLVLAAEAGITALLRKRERPGRTLPSDHQKSQQPQ